MGNQTKPIPLFLVGIWVGLDVCILNKEEKTNNDSIIFVWGVHQVLYSLLFGRGGLGYAFEYKPKRISTKTQRKPQNGSFYQLEGESRSRPLSSRRRSCDTSQACACASPASPNPKKLGARPRSFGTAWGAPTKNFAGAWGAPNVALPKDFVGKWGRPKTTSEENGALPNHFNRKQGS